MTTFKEPFLSYIKEALESAVSITWEGCHKIYVLMDKESHDQQIEFGYDMTMVEDQAEALNQLYEWFESSCGLRFISAIADEDQFHNLIAQFEYEGDDE